MRRRDFLKAVLGGTVAAAIGALPAQLGYGPGGAAPAIDRLKHVATTASKHANDLTLDKILDAIHKVRELTPFGRERLMVNRKGMEVLRDAVVKEGTLSPNVSTITQFCGLDVIEAEEVLGTMQVEADVSENHKIVGIVEQDHDEPILLRMFRLGPNNIWGTPDQWVHRDG